MSSSSSNRTDAFLREKLDRKFGFAFLIVDLRLLLEFCLDFLLSEIFRIGFILFDCECPPVEPTFKLLPDTDKSFVSIVFKIGGMDFVVICDLADFVVFSVFDVRLVLNDLAVPMDVTVGDSFLLWTDLGELVAPNDTESAF